MKRLSIIILVITALVVLAAGNTHRLLPAESDPCQQDLSHRDHISELPMFHCIGHSEYTPVRGKQGLKAVGEWDHVHPWMTREWHIDQGFDSEHTDRLLGVDRDQE